MAYPLLSTLTAAVLAAAPGAEPEGWRVGQALPDLVLRTIDGARSVELAELRGKPLVLVEFGSWSEDCRRLLPQWHERIEPWRAGGELRVLGVAQEQHPDRALLFTRWKEIDWPILWDPFGRTGSHELPHLVVADAHGIVLALDPEPQRLSEVLRACVKASAAPAPREAAAPRGGGSDGEPAVVAEPGEAASPALATPAAPTPLAALAALAALEQGERPLSPHVETLVQDALERPSDGRAQFRAGVALCLRHDSDERHPGDLQQALDLWRCALEREPGRILWRRRLEQYGPRVEKPFSFYGWVDVARRKIMGRGGGTLELAVEPTETEKAQPRRAFADPLRPEPDPGRAVEPDAAGWLVLEPAVAFAPPPAPGEERSGPRSANLLLALRPDAAQGIRWDNEAGEMRLWVGSGVPPGWKLSERLFTRLPYGPQTSAEERRYEIELELPADGPQAAEIGGYVLFHARAADGASGQRRHEFVVRVAPPSREPL